MAPLHVIWAQLQHFPSGWRMEPHCHAEFDELVLVLHGLLRTTLGAPRSLGPGMAIIHPTDRIHDHVTLGSSPLSILYCSFTGCPAIPVERLVVQDRGNRIESALRWIVDLRTEGTLAGHAAVAGLLSAMLHEFLSPGQGPESALVRCTRDYVQAHLAEALSLDDLARSCGLSKAHFSRRFHAATGQPPMRWLRDLRLATGRHLLSTTSLSVAAVAQQVGFTDRFQFARMMRQRSGRPPSGWRGRR